MKWDELTALLERHKVPITKWGIDGARSIEELLDEANLGETELFADTPSKEFGANPLGRRIRTVLTSVYVDLPEIGNKTSLRKVLVELKRNDQSEWLPRANLAAGQERRISEKVRFRRGETREEAVLRGLHEELNLRHKTTDKLIDMKELSRGLRFSGECAPKKVYASFRYPGLVTHNTMECAQWLMPNEYYRPEYKEYKDGKLIGVFRWQDKKEAVEEFEPLYG